MNDEIFVIFGRHVMKLSDSSNELAFSLPSERLIKIRHSGTAAICIIGCFANALVLLILEASTCTPADSGR